MSDLALGLVIGLAAGIAISQKKERPLTRDEERFWKLTMVGLFLVVLIGTVVFLRGSGLV